MQISNILNAQSFMIFYTPLIHSSNMLLLYATHPLLSSHFPPFFFFFSLMELDTASTFVSSDTLIAYVRKVGLVVNYGIVIKCSNTSAIALN